mgnify:CR=1 FL=1
MSVSMPHAALWVVQRCAALHAVDYGEVSMPHAALWVVQQVDRVEVDIANARFNAARGFVGGATRGSHANR